MMNGLLLKGHFKTAGETRWWQLKYLLFLPLPGEMIQFDNHIFSNGLVQPPA